MFKIKKNIFLLGLLTCLTLTSCKTAEDPLFIAQKRVNEMIQVDATATTAADDSKNSAAAAIADLILSKTQVQVKEVRESSWTVLITAPNMEKLTETLREEIKLSADSDQIDAYQEAVNSMTIALKQRLHAEKYELTSRTVSLQVKNGEPVWDESAVDALYGGLLTVYKNLLSEYKEVMDHEIQ